VTAAGQFRLANKARESQEEPGGLMCFVVATSTAMVWRIAVAILENLTYQIVA
jgi:hypothetical protein